MPPEAETTETTVTTTPETTPAPAEAPARPAWLAEKFKTPEDLAASYAELEKRQGTLRDTLRTELEAERFKARPEKPEGYEYKVDAKALGLPEGFEVKPPADNDPLLTEARRVMHDLGASPDQWNALTTAFLKSQAAQLPSKAAELKKLGEGAEARAAAVDAFLARNLSKEEYAVMANTVTTAAAISTMERLIKMAENGAGNVQSAPSGADGKPLNGAQVEALMRDPEYWSESEKGVQLRETVKAWHQAGNKIGGRRDRG